MTEVTANASADVRGASDLAVCMEGVNKWYAEFHALKDINLSVNRGERIVMEIAGTSREAARAAIGAAGGSVRTAIVMIRREVSRSAAEALLAASDNHLRPILGDPPPVEPA